MTDSFALTARPPWAVTMWVDEENIFVEIPNKTGPPYVTTFPLTEGGLAKALSVMQTAYRKTPKRQYVRPSLPRDPIAAKQAESALLVLRKLGMI